MMIKLTDEQINKFAPSASKIATEILKRDFIINQGNVIDIVLDTLAEELSIDEQVQEKIEQLTKENEKLEKALKAKAELNTSLYEKIKELETNSYAKEFKKLESKADSKILDMIKQLLEIR